MDNKLSPGLTSHGPEGHTVAREDAFGYPRDFLQNQFVYVVISPRARGLSVGVNLNPAVTCTFHCAYCEIDRAQPARAAQFDSNRMGIELRETLDLVRDGSLRQWDRYSRVPEDLLELRHVALSGDGEPTLSPHFVEAIEVMTHRRATGNFFKIVLVTNSTALDQPPVAKGLKLLTRKDEVWAKLDGGTQEYLNRVNGATVSLNKILNNILSVGRQRPVVIQSLFPAINGVEPAPEEIQEYVQRLKELVSAGAEISNVQIYSATRPTARAGCTHLPLKTLTQIARTVQKSTRLPVEVF